jgi:hypothetical protein
MSDDEAIQVTWCCERTEQRVTLRAESELTIGESGL